MYSTLKIDGMHSRLSSIISNGKVYKVPNHYNVHLDIKDHVNYFGTRISFNDTLEQVKERVECEENHKKINPIERSKEFQKTFIKIFRENP